MKPRHRWRRSLCGCARARVLPSPPGSVSAPVTYSLRDLLGDRGEVHAARDEGLERGGEAAGSGLTAAVRTSTTTPTSTTTSSSRCSTTSSSAPPSTIGPAPKRPSRASRTRASSDTPSPRRTAASTRSSCESVSSGCVSRARRRISSTSSRVYCVTLRWCPS